MSIHSIKQHYKWDKVYIALIKNNKTKRQDKVESPELSQNHKYCINSKQILERVYCSCMKANVNVQTEMALYDMILILNSYSGVCELSLGVM